ncbi:MAG: gliding motility-associated C-terminal domain-containing protein [Saprospiraceae bacterium]
MLRSLLTLGFIGFMVTLFGQNNFHRVYTVDPDHHTKNQTAIQLADGNLASLDLLEDTLRNAANDLLITLFDKKGGAASKSQNQGSKAFRLTSLGRNQIFLPQLTSLTRIGTQFYFTSLLQENNKIFKLFGSLNPDGQLTWVHKYLPSRDTIGVNSPFLLKDFNEHIYLATNQRVFNRSQVSLAKANNAGLLEWSNNYLVTRDSISGAILNNTVSDLSITSDSTMSIAGFVQQTTSRLPFLMESDTLGNVLWSKMYVDTTDRLHISANVESIKLADSTFVFVGNVDSLNSSLTSFGFIVKTDTSGTVVWAQKINFGDSTNTKLNNLSVGNDRKIVVSGFMRETGSGPDFPWLAKLDLDGKLEFVKKYPRVNIDRNINGNLVSTMDSGYAIFSTVDDGSNYLNLVKTDINGETTCETDFPDQILEPLELQGVDLFWTKFDTSKIEKTDLKTDDYTLNLPIITLKRDPTYCPKDTINHLFDATVKDAIYYEWSTGVKGDSASMITVTDTELYSVIATIDNGKECFTLCDTAQLRRYAMPIAQVSFSLGDFCTTGLVTLWANAFAEAGIKSYLWNTGATVNNIKVGTAGTYSVTVTDNCDEIFVSSYELIRMPQIVTSVNITENFSSICQTGNGILEAIDNSFGLLPKKFEWSNGKGTQIIQISEAGEYCVTVTDICGNTASSCITIEKAKFRQVKIDDLIVDETNRCVDNTVLAEVFFTGDANILWSTDQTSKSIVVDLDMGNLTVIIRDKLCPNFLDSLTIPLNGINFLPLINIGIEQPIRCINDSITLTVLYDKNILKPSDATIIWSTGQNTESIKVKENGNYAVTVTDKNCAINRAGTAINFVFPLPTLELIPDSSALCTENTILLSAVLNDDLAPINNPNYIWNTGQTTTSIIINASGQYIVTVSDPQCVQNTVTGTFDFTFPDAGMKFASAFFPNTFDTLTMEYNATFGPYLGKALCPESIKDYEFYIFNRWGQKVFSSESIEDEWNGSMENLKESDNPMEVYIWAVRYTLFGIEYKDHGDVTLIRP